MDELTQERLKQLITYDPDTGLIKRINRRGLTRGIPEDRSDGSRHPKGYLHMQFNGRAYLLHRLAWLYMTGKWPKDQLDHINGIRSDNRWENLRQVNNSINVNNKIGSGYWYDSYSRTHRARLFIDGKRIHLGNYNTRKESQIAYENGCKRYGLQINR